MRYNKEIQAYINDEKFSNGLDISFLENLKPQSRLEMIVDFCRNKKVIHVGCADHIPLIKQKIDSNRWLHKLLIENTISCVGIDNNAEAIAYLKDTLSIENVYCMDVEQDNLDFILTEKWDTLVLGEIIEHVDDPIQFLKNIKRVFSGKVNSIVISAPNVFTISTINDIKNNNENINTNHNYWFSPYTLNRIVHRAGFTNIEFSFAERVALPLCEKVTHRIKKAFKLPITFKSNHFAVIVITADF